MRDYHRDERRSFEEPNEGYLARIGEFTSNSWKSFKELCRETPVEIFLGIALGMGVGVIGSSMSELNRKKQIPLGFSEIRQIEKNLEYNGEKIKPITEFYAKLNDASMKIFECWNQSWSGNLIGDNHDRFASELDYRMDPVLKIYHYQLVDLLDQLPNVGFDALKEMQELNIIRNKTMTVNDLLANSWSESHEDHYRTETYTDIETDSDGDIKTVTKTKQVYDHTTHTYDYNKESGERASNSLDALVGEHPNIDWPEQLIRTDKTNAEGEYAATSSRKEDGFEPSMVMNQLLEIANTWNTGSNYNQNQPIIFSSFSTLPSHTNAWRIEKEDASSTSYNTGSRSDSGPRWVRTLESALRDGETLERNLTEIIIPITEVQTNAPEMADTIKKYIGVVLDGHEGDEDDLQDKIMETALGWYEGNFKGGFDVDRFRIYMPILIGLLGGLLGGLGGFGMDKYGQRKGWPRHNLNRWRRDGKN